MEVMEYVCKKEKKVYNTVVAVLFIPKLCFLGAYYFFFFFKHGQQLLNSFEMFS